MRKILFCIVALLGFQQSYAQTPLGIPYQAAARNSSGAILSSTPVSVRFSIHDATAGGTIVYKETHSVTTTNQGLFSLNVGQGTPVTGTFSGINWGTNAKYMQVELDPTGGSSYIDMGTQQMMSVPYALHAGTSGSSSQWTTSGSNIHNANTGKVGIGTTTAAARLHVADSSVVFTGPADIESITPGNPPISGAGSRMMWYADKAAFRAGHVTYEEWDKDSVGIFSVALGYGPIASGDYSVALGFGSLANGDNSVALGNSRATGFQSFAIGTQNISNGFKSLALGVNTEASGEHATSLGFTTIASGSNSTAMGNNTTASGENSFASGFYSTASGINATAIGNYCVASGHQSLALGDGGNANTFGAIGIGGSAYGGDYAIAIGGVGDGLHATGIGGGYAIGDYSKAFGHIAQANGNYATALGNFATSNGDYSTSIGNNAEAYGNYATAYGNFTLAVGDYSTTIGNNVSTNNKKGSFAIGDASDLVSARTNDAHNQMMMRFAGGYKLYNDTFATKGLEITPSGSAKYMSNVTATFTDRSIVDKHYVDSVAAGGSSITGWATSGTNIHNTNTGKVGIGTSTPAARLHVSDSSVVFTGGNDPGFIGYEGAPVSGPGFRMMWIPDYGAFRVGAAYENEWDTENVGLYSFASGLWVKALGANSTAMGQGSTATGQGSTAIGRFTTASGQGSVAMGADGTTASGEYGSIAMGVGSIASGSNGAIAMGFMSIASGDQSTAIGGGQASGQNSIAIGGIASGLSSTAIGFSTASGESSTAMGGYVSTNGKTGAFAVGDYSGSYSTPTLNDAPNQMMMRFAGGYKLYTSSDLSTGALMNAGDNSWSTISDRNKKENFAAVDGEAFLRKIAKFNLTSWNYKGQDPATHRHYGPMAQDFYAAFGTDKYGTIGNDTTISQADMEGVSFIAIQALVKENEALKAKINQLENKNSTLNNELNVLKAELTTNLQETNNRMQEIEKLLRKENTAAK